jgi:transposase
MDRQTLRDWVHAYNAKGPNGLINATSPGRPPKLTKAQKEKLRPIIVAGPDPVKDGVVRWPCVDLKRVIKKRFGVDLGEISVGRLLKELGFSYVSARPQHPEQSPRVIEILKKFTKAVEKALTKKGVRPGTSIEIWFQDEARVGQKNGLVYQWAERGSRPRQARDQRYENAYIFGAICPARDVGAALILPHADGWAMQQHLDEISRHVVTGAHAVVLLDQAG